MLSHHQKKQKGGQNTAIFGYLYNDNGGIKI